VLPSQLFASDLTRQRRSEKSQKKSARNGRSRNRKDAWPWRVSGYKRDRETSKEVSSGS
jgi:hypothetical protein